MKKITILLILAITFSCSTKEKADSKKKTSDLINKKFKGGKFFLSIMVMFLFLLVFAQI